MRQRLGTSVKPSRRTLRACGYTRQSVGARCALAGATDALLLVINRAAHANKLRTDGRAKSTAPKHLQKALNEDEGLLRLFGQDVRIEGAPVPGSDYVSHSELVKKRAAEKRKAANKARRANAAENAKAAKKKKVTKA